MSELPIVAIDARDACAPQLRGWGRYARCLIEALREGGQRPFELLLAGERARGPEVLFEQLGLPLQLRRRRAALVHSPNCFLPLLRHCPGVVTIHDLAFETWPEDFAPRTRLKYRTLAPLAVRSAQRVICPSRFTAEDVCTRYGIEADKVRVIAEAPALGIGGDPSGSLADRSASEPYILAVGDLRRKKNLAALVDAYVALRRDPGIPHRLVLAGVDTGEGRRLAAQADGQPLELTGYLDDAALDALLAGADVLAQPSLYEGFGLVLLEAMARGTPVIAARAGALPETGGGAALYFDRGDPDGLRDSLAALLGDERERRRRSELGRVWAGRFSWARTASETAVVYEELL